MSRMPTDSRPSPLPAWAQTLSFEPCRNVTSHFLHPDFKDWVSQPDGVWGKIFAQHGQEFLGWFTAPSEARYYFSSLLLNSLMRRTYDNPLIHDLYILHELSHCISLDAFHTYEKETGDAVRVNEIVISLWTEAVVYQLFPHWVGKTFSSLWINHPKTQEQLNQNLYQTGLPVQNILSVDDWKKEKRYKDLFDRCASELSWLPIDKINDLWWIRRLATHSPQNSDDQGVAKYEVMAEKWLTILRPHLPAIWDSRKRLKDCQNQTDLQAWCHAKTPYINGLGLPWGGVMLKQKKSIISQASIDLPVSTA